LALIRIQQNTALIKSPSNDALDKKHSMIGQRAALAVESHAYRVAEKNV
jgi:hypothetical protein